MQKKIKYFLFFWVIASIPAFASTAYKVDNNRSSFINDAQAQYSLISYVGTIDFASAGFVCVVRGILK